MKNIKLDYGFNTIQIGQTQLLTFKVDITDTDFNRFWCKAFKLPNTPVDKVINSKKSYKTTRVLRIEAEFTSLNNAEMFKERLGKLLKANAQRKLNDKYSWVK